MLALSISALWESSQIPEQVKEEDQEKKSKRKGLELNGSVNLSTQGNEIYENQWEDVLTHLYEFMAWEVFFSKIKIPLDY